MMPLLDKLIGYVHPVFDLDAHSVIAFRLRHSSAAFRWSVLDGVLRGFDDEVELFAVSLEGLSLAALIDQLSTLDGLVVSDAAEPALLASSAQALLTGTGAQARSNGDALRVYTSLLWMYMAVMAGELAQAKADVLAMLDQMSFKTADEAWLDEWGGYFGVARQVGELDRQYANRIVVEVMRPRGNNKAIELALLEYFGQEAQVVDLIRHNDVTYTYTGAITHDGSWLYRGTSDIVYGLFQVMVGYDILSGNDQAEFAVRVRALVEKFRDAGTQMDSLTLLGSTITDAASDAPSDESAGMTIATSAYFNGVYRHSGAARYAGTALTSELLL